MKILLLVAVAGSTFYLADPVAAGVPPSVTRDICGGQVFEFITRQQMLPANVRVALAKTFQQKKLLLANPGEDFQQTDFAVIKPGHAGLPTRRLLFAFRTASYFVVYYESLSAGLGANALVFSINGKNAKMSWGGVEVDHDKLAKNPAELMKRICNGRLISDRAFFW
jgi:hypothetical protein